MWKSSFAHSEVVSSEMEIRTEGFYPNRGLCTHDESIDGQVALYDKFSPGPLASSLFKSQSPGVGELTPTSLLQCSDITKPKSQIPWRGTSSSSSQLWYHNTFSLQLAAVFFVASARDISPMPPHSLHLVNGSSDIYCRILSKSRWSSFCLSGELMAKACHPGMVVI